MARNGDGLPTLPTGEPILHRWFVVAMLILVPVGLAVVVWAFTSFDRDPITPAERRPPGTAAVTHGRGAVELGDVHDTEPAPACAAEVELVGDEGARAAARRALAAACQLLQIRDLPAAEAGLRRLVSMQGQVRVAVFERTGVDASTRIEDGRPVLELNAKFQFEDATRAAPFLLHELVHLGGGTWPGEAVDAAGELEAMLVQAAACEQLTLGPAPPRGCLDAAALLDDPDPLVQLREAGYPPEA